MNHRNPIFNLRLLAAVLAVSVAPAACAQGMPFSGPMRHEMLFVAGAQLDRERVIQGAPYCADAVHETVQALADGNRIVQRQSSRQCRDGEGRTRQEVISGERRHVYLRDPVAHEAWLLDADGKRAVRLDGLHRPAGAEGGEYRMMWDRVLGWGRTLREQLHMKLGGDGAPLPPPPPPPPGAGMDGGPESMRITLHGMNPAELGPGPGGMMPPPIALHARLMGPRGPGVTNLLPAETIEGLKADGKRTSWTIEAGKVGNEKPIVIVNEVWSSPELGITLRSRDVNPLNGEDSFRVQNVARGEPDAALFKVPQDYAKVAPPQMAAPR